MKDITHNKNSVVQHVSQATGYPQNVTADIVDATFEFITECFLKHETVGIKGFGRFGLTKRKAGRSYNPYSGEFIDVPERFHPNIKFSLGIARQLNGIEEPAND